MARDLDLLPVWSNAIGLDRYMSRCRPRDELATGHNPVKGLFWFVIVVDGFDVGTIWLEPGIHSNQAVLGIFIGREDLLGQGLGARAIFLAIAAFWKFHPTGAQVVLNVREANVRAIACYKSCGFQPISTTRKDLPSGKRIPVLLMQLDLGIPQPMAGSGM